MLTKVLYMGLLLLLIIGAGMCEDQAGIAENATVGMDNVTVDANVTSNVTAEAAPLSLQYIWSLSLSSGEQITMALNQSGSELFGSAKYEGAEPWNGVVVGSVSDSSVDLVLTALMGKSLVPMVLKGSYSEDTITGTYSVYSPTGVVESGKFTAMWINPDTSVYTPAVIPEAAAPAPAAQTNTTETEQTTTTTQPTQLSTRFFDVKEKKEEIFSSPASIIPPAMGMSALT
ncbi:MAG: hypothetical protein H5T42_02920 [Methanothrix sp.]|uniref:Uncharacterized protein n=1 Tax=Methanothrix thermoacetophila (strain DSM 6194 / JCM 14653 / NBRC 101360 / PT) TaxID=349307 RepID=A0B8I1_METTP|nr:MULTISPECIES: hypothetical protein [Methanothrix]ABK15005.1 hypothetical protein Mthe_1226 [Methanothrix thermoacetophila PT]MBC7079413.1 hypothetical protein [Methanothrix sp.]NPU86880.1 hypothetical protein [Methanothrix sp.]